MSHPLAAEHIQTEWTAETVYPILFLGKSETHPRASICEPAVAAVQGIGSVGDIQYIIEGISLLRSVFAAGSAGGDACNQQSNTNGVYKLMSHIRYYYELNNCFLGVINDNFRENGYASALSVSSAYPY